MVESDVDCLQFFVLLCILMLVELSMACVFLIYSREVGNVARIIIDAYL